MCRTFITQPLQKQNKKKESRKILCTLQKGNRRLGKHVLEVTRLALDEENDCRFVVHREEHWIYTRIHGQYQSGKVAGVICD